MEVIGWSGNVFIAIIEIVYACLILKFDVHAQGHVDVSIPC